jgi:8-oxo-dGTP pyrophosphatase MutT (NUDIX family)
MNHPIVQKIQQALIEPLPGLDAQFRMAKIDRPILTLEQILDKNPRLAAVQIMLYPKDSSIHFVMIERQDYEGTHSGQMAFPGGKKEPDDENLLKTALRETHEEIGWNILPEHVLGALTPLYIPVSHFLVYPYISYIHSPQEYNHDPREVKSIFEFPLLNFFENENKIEHTFFYKNQDYTTPAYSIYNKIIWGASAMILSELEEILNRNL